LISHGQPSLEQALHGVREGVKNGGTVRPEARLLNPSVRPTQQRGRSKIPARGFQKIRRLPSIPGRGESPRDSRFVRVNDTAIDESAPHPVVILLRRKPTWASLAAGAPPIGGGGGVEGREGA